MKTLFKISILAVLFLFSMETASAQIVSTGVDLKSNQASGWFNQIRFWNGTSSIRHVITDHGGRDRLVIYPGFGGGAKLSLIHI